VVKSDDGRELRSFTFKDEDERYWFFQKHGLPLFF
jgi:hypothetical protein